MSVQTIVLLPGWALGSAPLAPLAEALHRRLPACYRVECIDYPGLTSHRPESWVAALDHALPQDAWLAGWSLGGMLATSLAQWRGRRARGLIALAANASFVTRSGWPQAMTGEALEDFRCGLRASPTRTFKRFSRLSAQGGGIRVGWGGSCWRRWRRRHSIRPWPDWGCCPPSICVRSRQR
ncbi:alpha/beta fold hydrolase [Salinicola acroporae]|uniref:AB hydrolase-1 domain-containing protein n=1 Tax=Salinicola acroporae TaxID=1541440 RepID=A0ABT6I5H0_9GAMM|nr:alpha/beta fold hydrolase [Salinicola acroporae]MDH4572876.1 hypothetical protein [Salinicola acroporae]